MGLGLPRTNSTNRGVLWLASHPVLWPEVRAFMSTDGHVPQRLEGTNPTMLDYLVNYSRGFEGGAY